MRDRVVQYRYRYAFYRHQVEWIARIAPAFVAVYSRDIFTYTSSLVRTLECIGHSATTVVVQPLH